MRSFTTDCLAPRFWWEDPPSKMASYHRPAGSFKFTKHHQSRCWCIIMHPSTYMYYVVLSYITSLSNHSLNNSSCANWDALRPSCAIQMHSWNLHGCWPCFLRRRLKCQVILCKILRVSLLGWMRHGSLLGHLQRYFVIKPGSAKWITFFLQNWVVVWNIFYFHPCLSREMIQFDAHIFQMGWFNHQLENLSLSFLQKLACLNLNLCQASFQVLCLSLNGITLNSHFVGNGTGNPKVAWHMAVKNRLRLFPFPGVDGDGCWSFWVVQLFQCNMGEAWRSLYWEVVVTCK